MGAIPIFFCLLEEKIMNGKIIMIASEDGHGKTRGICSFPEEIALLDTEYPKSKQTISAFYADKLITTFPCQVYHTKSDPARGILRGNIDIDKTIDEIYKNIGHILDNYEQYETVVVDGVSDLRRMVAEHWIKHDPKHRKVIGDNPSAWSEINDIVKERMLFPLINTARILDKTLILTSKMTDTRTILTGEDGASHSYKTGTKEPDVSEWIGYKMDVKILLSCDKNKQYWINWLRAPTAGLPARENITDIELYDVFRARGVL